MEFYVFNEKEMKEQVKRFKDRGFKKVSDCMWVQIWTDGYTDTEWIISREY